MKDKKTLALIAGAVAAVALIIVAIVSLSNPAKGLINKYYKAYSEEDGEFLYKITPQIVFDAANDEIDDKDDKKTEEDFIKDLDKSIDFVVDFLPDDYERKHKVVRTVKVDKDIVADFNEYLDKESDYSDVYNEKEHEVKAAYIIDVRIDATADEKFSSTYTTFYAIKENGKWKLITSDMDIDFDWYNGLEKDEDEK